MLCFLRVSLNDVVLDFLLFEVSDSLSNVVFLSALQASLDYVHLLFLGLFDADDSSIHLVLRQHVCRLSQVD